MPSAFAPIGAAADRVFVSGNLKYDLELPAATPLSNWLETEARRRGRSPIIVAGSVVATEEPLARMRSHPFRFA